MSKPPTTPKPQVVKSQDLPHFIVETLCLNCKEVIRGEWIGAEPQRHTLECPACGQSHVLDVVEKYESKPTAPTPPFSEDVMRLALARLASVAQHLHGNADDDDPVAILSGAIDELLHKRNAIAGVQQWMQQWLAENTRR